MRATYLLVALLAASGSAFAQVAADGAEADRASVAAEGSVLAVTPAGSGELEVSGVVEVEYVDQARHMVGVPEGESAYENYHRAAQEGAFTAGALSWTSASAGAVLVIDAAEATLEGELEDVAAKASAAHVLEESHVFDNTSGHPHYYAYRAPAGVAVTARQGTWTASGLLRIYAWGLDTTLEHEDGQWQVPTGASQVATAPGLTQAHDRYLLLTVDGTLTYTENQASTLYAPTVTASGQQVELLSATGAIGRHRLAGDGALRDAEVELSERGGALLATVQHSASVTGPGVRYDAPTPWLTLSGVAAVVAVACLGLALRRGTLGSAQTWLALSARQARAGRMNQALLAVTVARLAGAGAGEAAMHRGQAFLLGQKPMFATRAFASAYDALAGVERGEAAWWQARGHAQLGQGRQAAACLASAVLLSPDLLQLAASHRDFLALAVDDPTFRTAMARLTGLAFQDF